MSRVLEDIQELIKKLMFSLYDNFSDSLNVYRKGSILLLITVTDVGIFTSEIFNGVMFWGLGGGVLEKDSRGSVTLGILWHRKK